MAMTRARANRTVPRPMDAARLDALALAYVARFATSKARLTRYLSRKLREAEWDDPVDAVAALDAAVERCTRLGFVDDGEFARMRGAALTRKGLGLRRVHAQLYADGIGDADAAPVIDHAADRRLATAIAFARRRRLGPFGAGMPSDPKARNKLIAAFLRAGHDSATVQRVLAVAPGDSAALAELDAEAEAG